MLINARARAARRKLVFNFSQWRWLHTRSILVSFLFFSLSSFYFILFYFYVFFLYSFFFTRFFIIVAVLARALQGRDPVLSLSSLGRPAAESSPRSSSSDEARAASRLSLLSLSTSLYYIYTYIHTLHLRAVAISSKLRFSRNFISSINSHVLSLSHSLSAAGPLSPTAAHPPRNKHSFSRAVRERPPPFHSPSAAI